MRKSWLALPALVAAGAAFPAAPHALLGAGRVFGMRVAQWTVAWSYDGPRGPDHWGDLDSSYAVCKTGREQSPVDIRDVKTEALPPLRFESHAAPLKYLINNGHAIRVNFHAPGSGDFLLVGDKRYQLTQFHFHRPAEELVNGKAYDLVLHLMYEGSGGEVVGAAVLMKAGRANATVQQLWDHMPATESKEIDVPGVNVDPGAMLPTNTGYYLYAGSLTAPPCTEHVTWYVLKTPVEVSAGQVAAVSRIYPHNVRPPQPLNGRVVKASR